MPKNSVANSRKKTPFIPAQSLNQKDLKGSADAAKNMAESLDGDSAIAQSYAKLAKAAAATHQVLAQASRVGSVQ